MSGKVRRRRPSKVTSCGEKRKYTRHQAVHTAAYMRRHAAMRVSAYRCLYCHMDDGAHAWHIGH